jgi:hypothetical protein
VIEYRFVCHRLVVLALDTFAAVSAENAFLKALTILFDTKGLATRTPLAFLSPIQLHSLWSSATGNSLIHFGEVTAFLVATVHALAVLVTL